MEHFIANCPVGIIQSQWRKLHSGNRFHQTAAQGFFLGLFCGQPLGQDFADALFLSNIADILIAGACS